MQLVPVSVSLQVKMFVFNSPAPADRPKAFDKNIIQSATFPIHSNLYIISNQRVEKRVACKLATLRTSPGSMLKISGLPHLVKASCKASTATADRTKVSQQSVAQSPTQNKPAVPVNNCRSAGAAQVQKPIRHRYIRNISRPDLIDSLDWYTPQQIGIDRMAWLGLRYR